MAAEIITSPERLKGDVRTLGDSDFVRDILFRAAQTWQSQLAGVKDW
jgi:hypothetical protein